LSAWPRSGSREFESAARRGEQRRGVDQRETGERGVFLLGYLFLDKQEKVTALPGHPGPKTIRAQRDVNDS